MQKNSQKFQTCEVMNDLRKENVAEKYPKLMVHTCCSKQQSTERTYQIIWITCNGSSSLIFSFWVLIKFSYSFLMADKSGRYVLKSSIRYSNTSWNTWKRVHKKEIKTNQLRSDTKIHLGIVLKFKWCSALDMIEMLLLVAWHFSVPLLLCCYCEL